MLLVSGKIKVVQVGSPMLVSNSNCVIGVYDRTATIETIVEDIYEYANAK